MANLTFAQAKALFGPVASGELTESLNERILTLLAIMASAQNPDGSAWVGFNSGGGAIAAKQFTYTAANVAMVNQATFANLPGIGTTGDLTVPAAIGDVIEVNFMGIYDVNVNVVARMDCATIVAGSPVNYVSSGGAVPLTNGIPCWGGVQTALGSTYPASTGPIQYKLVAGDISGGNVTVRLQYICGGSKNLFAGGGNAVIFNIKNLKH